MKPYFSIVVMLLFVASLTAADKSEQGVKVKVRRHSRGKGHMCYAEVTVTNANDTALWFVLGRANDALPANGILASQYEREAQGIMPANMPFSAVSYGKNGNTAVVVDSYGKARFDALLIPSRGRVHFKSYGFYDGKPITFVDVWEAKSLKVNGETALEDWLPYPVRSSTQVTVEATHNGDGKVLDWHHARDPAAKPYPKETIKTVEADIVRQYRISLAE